MLWRETQDSQARQEIDRVLIMGQVTEDICRHIIEYADRNERFPLTAWELKQLALAWQASRAAIAKEGLVFSGDVADDMLALLAFCNASPQGHAAIEGVIAGAGVVVACKVREDNKRDLKISDEMWHRLFELCGEAWLDDGHQELVIDTLLNIAIPIQEAKQAETLK